MISNILLLGNNDKYDCSFKIRSRMSYRLLYINCWHGLVVNLKKVSCKAIISVSLILLRGVVQWGEKSGRTSSMLKYRHLMTWLKYINIYIALKLIFIIHYTWLRNPHPISFCNFKVEFFSKIKATISVEKYTTMNHTLQICILYV